MKKGCFISEHGWNAIERAYPLPLRQKMEREVLLLSNCLTGKELEREAEHLRDVSVLFSTWGMPRLNEEQIERFLPNLEAVFYGAGSVQYFAKPFFNKGIRIFSAASANAVPVAEYTVAQILLANKGFFQAARKIQDRAAARSYSASFPGNMDCKVGIIGAGAIGKLVIRMLKPFALEILVYDPFLPDCAAQELGVKKVDLETLFAECQTISNHLADNPQTRGILHYGLFSRMKPNAAFINTGRGAQVVEEDLCRALAERPDRTALLDVTFPEPPAEGSPLTSQNNIILTPHIAGSMSNEVGRMGIYMFQAYRDFLHQVPSACEVTADMLATMA